MPLAGATSEAGKALITLKLSRRDPSVSLEMTAVASESAAKLQLRGERVSQPFYRPLPQRSTAELLKGVLTALPEILRKRFLHLLAEIAIVHHHIQFFVNFSRTGVEIGRPDHREQRVRHDGFDMDHRGLVFKNPGAAFEQLSVPSAAGGFG